MSENKKALVFGETKGLINNFDQTDFKSISLINQDLCSFCKGLMIDDSICFKGISACRLCLLKFRHLQKALQTYYTNIEVKYES